MLSKIAIQSETKTKVNRNPLNETGSFWGLLKLTAPTNEYKLKNFSNVIKPLAKIGISKLIGAPTFYGALFAKQHDSEGNLINDYGLVSLKLVTTAGVKAVTDKMLDGSGPLELFDYHAIGTGTDAPAAGDTVLQTEVEDRVQDTTMTASTSVGDNYRYDTSATIAAMAARAVTEHGLFSLDSAGVMFDRSTFSVINLANGDSLTTTYQVTFNAGS